MFLKHEYTNIHGVCENVSSSRNASMKFEEEMEEIDEIN